MSIYKYPRIIFAGLSGDSGKTFLTCGALAALKKRGLKARGFKKGPDYIDAAWIKTASGAEAYNLDTYMMSRQAIRKSFLKRGFAEDISLIEGNRGLFDGFDTKGSHSTAELAKLLNAPVVIILNVTKVTRTAAAIILGCREFDKDLNIAGVVINQVAGKRHEKITRESIESITGIPVLGAIPKIKSKLPSRHLGLITPGEHKDALDAVGYAAKAVEEYTDLDSIIEIARNAGEMDKEEVENNVLLQTEIISAKDEVRIGYFKDKAFSFYYPENLEALMQNGAELVPISSVSDSSLPEISGLYIGGGFPEENIKELAANRSLMRDLKNKAESGLPIYAECGGFIYLGESIAIGNIAYPLAGVLPVKFKMESKPQGHGYMEAEISEPNPFFKQWQILRGHEFHYSKIIWHNQSLLFSSNVRRGKGSLNNKDGIVYKNIFAGYLHLHALATPEWAENFTRLALKYKKEKIN